MHVAFPVFRLSDISRREGIFESFQPICLTYVFSSICPTQRKTVVKDLILYICEVGQGSTDFSKMQEPLQNYACQKGDMVQVPY